MKLGYQGNACITDLRRPLVIHGLLKETFFTFTCRNDDNIGVNTKKWLLWFNFTELLKRFVEMDLSGTPLLMLKNAIKDLREAFFQGR